MAKTLNDRPSKSKAAQAQATPAPASPLPAGRRVVKDLFSWSEHPQRTLLLGAAGAILGLLLAGFGLLTAEGTRVRSVPPEAVAMVNGRPVLISDYVAQLEAETGAPLSQATAAQKRKVLNDMVSEELFVQRGLEVDEPSVDPDVRAALVSAVQTQVAVDVITQIPDDGELRAYYEAQRANYSSMGELSVKDFAPSPNTDPSKAMRDARAAVAEIRAGGAPDAVASHYGFQDTGKVSGEELYFAAKIHLGEVLFARAAALKAGQASDPVPQMDGPHFLVVLGNRTPVPRSFEESRQQVLTDYKQMLEARTKRNEDKFLRERADILIAKAFQ